MMREKVKQKKIENMKFVGLFFFVRQGKREKDFKRNLAKISK